MPLRSCLLVFRPLSIASGSTLYYLVKTISLQAKGSAGPSGLDSTYWCRMCSAYKGVSNHLCEGPTHHLLQKATNLILEELCWVPIQSSTNPRCKDLVMFFTNCSDVGFEHQIPISALDPTRSPPEWIHFFVVLIYLSVVIKPSEPQSPGKPFKSFLKLIPVHLLWS